MRKKKGKVETRIQHRGKDETQVVCKREATYNSYIVFVSSTGPISSTKLLYIASVVRESQFPSPAWN